MELGTVIFYYDKDEFKPSPDYSIVTEGEGHGTWAYWIREKRKLTFSISRPCYTKVGSPVIGKWND